MKVLITGGLGFIGRHLTRRLLNEGHSVTILDSLEPQVHHHHYEQEFNGQIRLHREKISSPSQVKLALAGNDSVVHLAAQVGVGQSMYDLTRYVYDNDYGTSVLWEEIISRKDSINRVVVASSMSIYGEGPVNTYGDPKPITEDTKPRPTSIYAVSKLAQEYMSLVTGKAHNIPTIALRFFNVYGEGQSLNNPYTGVLAIFASQLLNNKEPLIFGNGKQMRDFIHVSDIVEGIMCALEADRAGGQAYNIGTGYPTSVLYVAEALAHLLDKEIIPCPSGIERVGDIQNCYADVEKAKSFLGFKAKHSFSAESEALINYVEWLSSAQAVDRVQTATNELAKHGLLRTT